MSAVVSCTLACLVIAVSWLALRLARPAIYDLLIVHMTRRWYRAVLTRVEPGSSILDVGIGTRLFFVCLFVY
jgi:hypothetical protein